jgi:CBS domain-containing protein
LRILPAEDAGNGLRPRQARKEPEKPVEESFSEGVTFGRLRSNSSKATGNRLVQYSKVDSILLLCPEDLAPTPCVSAGEKITRAIELMLHHNVSRIAVVSNRRVIGMIRLEDAFQEIGLDIPAK